MARRTKEEAEATRESILDAAEEAFLENGVSRTTLEQIARRAGVTRGAVYWHFRDKNDLFSAMIDRVRLPMDELVESLRRQSDGDTLDTMRSLCRHVLRILHSNPRERRVYTIVVSRCEFVSEINPVVERQQQLDKESVAEITKDFERAAMNGELREGLQPRIVALATHAFVKGILFDWLRSPELFDLEKDGMAMIDLFFSGLRAQTQPGRSPEPAPRLLPGERR